MVINETLRLIPPAIPFNSKISTRDLTLPNGIKIHKGQMLTYTPWVVHRIPKYWGTDAEKFRPERWEDPTLIKHQYQFIPFQKGPRQCLGMNMAYEEAKSCISLLVQNGVVFQYAATKPPILIPNAVFSTKEGVSMKVIIKGVN